MRRVGDTFNGGGAAARGSSVVVNPGEPKWTEQVIYFFRSLTGQDVPDTFRAIVWTFNAAIGRLVDPTANLASLLTDSKASMSVVSLLKAVGLQTIDLNAELDAISTKVDGVNTALINVNTTLDEIATQTATIAADTTDILTELQRPATPLFVEGAGFQSLSASGRLAWVSWSAPGGGAAVRCDVAMGGGVVQAAIAESGAFYFDPALPIGNYSISVNPGAVNAILNAGVIQ